VEEEKRARDYLDTESFKKLMAVVEQELIANYAETLVEVSAVSISLFLC
jgi:hypothetical protein